MFAILPSTNNSRGVTGQGTMQPSLLEIHIFLKYELERGLRAVMVLIEASL